MRAKNEFRNIAANYDTKLILERVVDGKLMCPEACCGAPVVECTCGPDCPHCNCFMIHKAMKEKGFTDKLLKEYYEVEDDDYNPVLNAAARSIIGTTVTLSNGHTGKVVDVDVQSGYMVVKTADGDTFKAELGDDDIKYEDGEEFDNLHPGLTFFITDFENYLIDMNNPDGTDASLHDLKDIVDEIVNAKVLDDDVKIHVIGYLKQIARHAGLDESEITGEEGIFSDVNIEDNEEFNRLENKRERARDRAREAEDKGDWDEWNRQENERERSRDQLRDIEDNEEPKRGITGLNPRRSPELHSMKSHAIDKIDLNKWRKYPQDDVMKAVYRRYGRELPSVDSKDYNITWDKKIRPWLKEHEGTF